VSAVSYPTGGIDAESIAVGDFNGDGKLDLAVANPNNLILSILLGNGDGTFAAPLTSTPASGWISSLAVADFNGDGHADLVVGNDSANSVTVLLGKGAGTFPTAISPGGADALTVAVGDFNGDGFPDIAAPNDTANSITILLSTSSGACSSNIIEPFRL
jgi:hypothetical protein